MSNVIGAQFRKLQSPVDGPPVRVRLVGPTSITSHGKPVVIPLKKARALLGYLVVREGSEIALQRAGSLRYMGLRAPARCMNRLARGICSKQGRPSQANRGPKE